MVTSGREDGDEQQPVGRGERPAGEQAGRDERQPVGRDERSERGGQEGNSYSE